jgi:kynurenine formamidase
MTEIIDLSVEISLHVSHEQWDGIVDSEIVSPAVNRLEFGEHTGTHVDAINHKARQYRGRSIDRIPLTMFYTPQDSRRNRLSGEGNCCFR